MLEENNFFNFAYPKRKRRRMNGLEIVAARNGTFVKIERVFVKYVHEALSDYGKLDCSRVRDVR